MPLFCNSPLKKWDTMEINLTQNATLNTGYSAQNENFLKLRVFLIILYLLVCQNNNLK